MNTLVSRSQPALPASPDSPTTPPVEIREEDACSLIRDSSEHPLHKEVVRRACELWQQYGCPTENDEAIWREAERSVTEAARERAAAS